MKAMQIYRAKISPQGQITLPISARMQLGVVSGNFINLYVEDGNLAVTSKSPIEKHFGKVAVVGDADPVKAIRDVRNSFKKRIKQ